VFGISCTFIRAVDPGQIFRTPDGLRQKDRVAITETAPALRYEKKFTALRQRKSRIKSVVDGRLTESPTLSEALLKLSHGEGRPEAAIRTIDKFIAQKSRLLIGKF